MRSTFILLLILMSAFCNAQIMTFNKVNFWKVGLDLSQFSYIRDTKSPVNNIAVYTQYQPYRFMSLNGTLGYNKVNSTRSDYPNLNEYESKGGFAKLGFDLSIRVSEANMDKRLFFGYQIAALQFVESGIFEMKDLYWSDVYLPYRRANTSFFANEIILGYHWTKKNWGLKFQVYSMGYYIDKHISYDNETVDKFRSPFVPGYGYRRGGLNLILLYRLK